MIESIMYFAIGFCVAGLSVLMVVPLVHGRAVRLITRQLEGAIPSMAEILADKDLQRAEFAMSTRRLEVSLEQLKTKAACQLAELGGKGDAINRLKIELGALQDQLRTSEENSAIKANGVREAQCALSEKETELAKLTSALEERSVLADSQKVEIVALTGQVQTLKERLAQAGEEVRAAAARDAAVHDAERTLSEKESELAKLTSTLEERSVLIGSQKAEISALTRQVQTLKERLAQAGEEVSAADARRNTERINLNAAAHQLAEERVKFEKFRHRVAELVGQVRAQTNHDKILARRTQQDLESRLIEQSRLLNERELELKHLRDEIAIARKAEYDLRVAMIEIDGHTDAAAQNFKAENARLQAALDRANGDRARLAYELAHMRRQGMDTQAA